MSEDVWTIEELVALTEEVQKGEVEYKDKKFIFQYCELTEAEEPKVTMLEENASPEQKNEFYTKVGTERILAMVKKANDKNPKGTTKAVAAIGQLKFSNLALKHVKINEPNITQPIINPIIPVSANN